MADAGYDAEVSGIQAFLSMQHDKGDATPLNPGQVCITYSTDFPGIVYSEWVAVKVLKSPTKTNKERLPVSKRKSKRKG